MKDKISDIESFGYERDEVLKITVEFPSIYSASLNSIKEKLLYFKEIGLDKKIIDNPKYLMQSVDLTYARYRYLTEDKGIEIDIKNADYLFRNAKSFEKQFGISKINLLERYSYDLEVRGKNKSDKALRKRKNA